MLKPRRPILNLTHPITRGLVFDSPFFEYGNSAVPRDIVTNNTSGTLTLGTGGFVTDLFGPAFNFDGTTTNLFYNTHPNQDSLSQFSFEALFYMKGYGGGNLGRMFVKSNGNGPGYAMVNVNSTDVRLYWNVQYTTSNAQYGIPTPSQNAWHHAVFTFDVNNFPGNIYLDGVLQTLTLTTNPTGTPTGESAHLYVGNTQSGLRGWNGYVGYLRQWNRVLNAQEVRQLAANPWVIYRKPGFYQALNSIAAVASTANFLSLLGVG